MTLNGQLCRDQILRKWKDRGAAASEIRMSPDRPFEERMEHRELVAVLKRRQEECETDLIINNRKIVKRRVYPSPPSSSVQKN